MGKKTKLIGPAGGKIARLVGDKLNSGDFAADAAQKLAKQTDEVVKKVRRVSKRRKYLGNTPGKSSATGRKVIDRMKEKGEIVTVGGEDYLLWKQPPNGPVQRVPLSDCDMGHHPVDAVSYWNNTGINHGPRSKEVRDWMLDPDNYAIQPSSWNRSQGASLGITYNDPPTP